MLHFDRQAAEMVDTQQLWNMIKGGWELSDSYCCGCCGSPILGLPDLWVALADPDLCQLIKRTIANKIHI
jgi:hypothetical protein